ncbi:TetR/AcrR family transcriptional regulator [Vibrio sp. RC27]
MSNEKNKKKTISEQKREAIVEAALQEFTAKGFKAVSMDVVAAEAGVSKRTVYNHFPSKEILFQKVVAHLLEASQKTECAPYNPKATLSEQLLSIGRAELDLLSQLSYQKVARVMMIECIRSPELAASALGEMSGLQNGLQLWLKEAVADGKLKKMDENNASRQFFSLLKANAFWPQLLEGAAPLSDSVAQKTIDDAVAMFLGFYEV